MALAQVIRFGQAYPLWEVEPGSGIFEPFCGMTSLNLTVNIETNSTNVPDCDDPDLPAWLVSDEVSKQMQIGGNGVADQNVLAELTDWLLNGGERTFRWFRSAEAGPAAGYFEAPGILSNYEESGERGQPWNLAVTILLNGRPEWVPAGT